VRPLSPQFRPYSWALSAVEIAGRAGIAPEGVLRFDGNTPPEPVPTARPETIAEALARIQSTGTAASRSSAIADYSGVGPKTSCSARGGRHP
jgi:hypothetical protein